MEKFKLGDILEHKKIPSIGLLLVVGIEGHFYNVRHITGIFDGGKGQVFIGSENCKKVGNIFEKGGGGK